MKNKAKKNIIELDFHKEEAFDEDIIKQIVASLRELNPRSLRIGIMVDSDTLMSLDFCKSYGDQLAITQFLQTSNALKLFDDMEYGASEDFFDVPEDNNDDEDE